MQTVRPNLVNYSSAYRRWKWKLPTYFNLSSLIDRWASDPKRIAIYWEGDEGETKALTYRELANYSNQCAGALTELGVRKEERVAIIMPRLLETYISYLGVVKSGAVAVPISELFAPRAIAYVLDNCDARYLVTTKDSKETILRSVLPQCRKIKKVIVVGGKTAGREVNFWDALAKQKRTFAVAKTKGSDLSTFLYTSGTTGMPKGVMHTHWWLLGNIPQVRYWQDVHPEDMVWCTADLTWITGLINAFLGPLAEGAAILSYEGRFSAARWFNLLETYGVTNLVSAPTAFRIIMANEKELKKRYKLKLRVVCGIGERVNDEIIKWWQKRFDLTVLDGYGQTECMSFICNYPAMRVKIGSCGKPTPGVIISIRDQKTGREITKPGVRGIIAVKRTSTPVLFRGYWKDAAKTRQTFHKAWYYAGDVAYRDRDGYVWIEGRDDDVIKYSGYRVGPYEVESTLLEHPAVVEAAVIGKPDPLYGHIIKALVVLKKGKRGGASLTQELQNFVKKHLAYYKYPREVVFVKELPKTQSGKIKRKVLRIAEEQAYTKHREAR
jgi:acetyl-CoA synthetase